MTIETHVFDVEVWDADVFRARTRRGDGLGASRRDPRCSTKSGSEWALADDKRRHPGEGVAGSSLAIDPRSMRSILTNIYFAGDRVRASQPARTI